MKITILGGGNWGTTLSILLSHKEKEITLWCRKGKSILSGDRENYRYLPGIRVPDSVYITSDIGEAINGAGVLIFAVTSASLREVARRVKESGGLTSETIVMSVVKGIEEKSLKRMSEVINNEIKDAQICVFSGPNIAREIVKGMPASGVCAAKNLEIAKRAQQILASPKFRTYISPDVIGVELGGALKNIIAIAAGMSDGLGFGANAKGALLTRGLAEITRLGTRMGAEPLTFSGLSGIGDLIATSISKNSRNRWLGEQVGRGKSLKKSLKEMVMVAEGVPTTRSGILLSKKYRVPMPITSEVYKVLFEGKSPMDALSALMSRELKPEIWG
jgi:glycerol-3-phosphate dehydrogenase (NAD(P)+)